MESIGNLANIVEAAIGRRVSRRFRPFEAVFPGRRDVRWRSPDTTRLTNTIGPVHWPSLEQIVEEVVERKAATLDHGHDRKDEGR